MTASEPWEAQIIAEVGDPNNTIGPVVEIVWDLMADRAAIDPRLQVLYTKRAALDARLAEEAPFIDFGSGQDRFSRSQVHDHLQAMRESTQAEITRIEQIARANRTPAFGALTGTSPESPVTPSSPDATDPRYAGDPYQSVPRP